MERQPKKYENTSCSYCDTIRNRQEREKCWEQCVPESRWHPGEGYGGARKTRTKKRANKKRKTRRHN